MSTPGERISVPWYKNNLTLPQGDVDFAAATREQLNGLRLIWEHLGLLSDLRSHIIAGHQRLLQFNWTDEMVHIRGPRAPFPASSGDNLIWRLPHFLHPVKLLPHSSFMKSKQFFESPCVLDFAADATETVECNNLIKKMRAKVQTLN